MTNKTGNYRGAPTQARTQDPFASLWVTAQKDAFYREIRQGGLSKSAAEKVRDMLTQDPVYLYLGGYGANRHLRRIKASEWRQVLSSLAKKTSWTKEQRSVVYKMHSAWRGSKRRRKKFAISWRMMSVLRKGHWPDQGPVNNTAWCKDVPLSSKTQIAEIIRDKWKEEALKDD